MLKNASLSWQSVFKDSLAKDPLQLANADFYVELVRPKLIQVAEDLLKQIKIVAQKDRDLPVPLFKAEIGYWQMKPLEFKLAHIYMQSIYGINLESHHKRTYFELNDRDVRHKVDIWSLENNESKYNLINASWQHNNKYLFSMPDFQFAYLTNPSERLDRFWKMQQTGQATDIELLVEGEVIKAHRAFLIAGSRFFEKMLLDSDFKEKNLSQIPLPEIKSSQFKMVLEFMYRGHIAEMPMEPETIAEIAQIGDRFDIPDLFGYCQDTFSKYMQKTELNDEQIILFLSLGCYFRNISCILTCLAACNASDTFRKQLFETKISKKALIYLNETALQTDYQLVKDLLLKKTTLNFKRKRIEDKPNQNSKFDRVCSITGVLADGRINKINQDGF